MAESSLWTCSLEASIEDMVLTVCVDAYLFNKTLFLLVISRGPNFCELRNF
jgi:hypothetical protein